MRWPAPLALVAAAVGVGGCGDGLLFRNDHRVTVISPEAFGSVPASFTVRWTAPDFHAPQDGHFVALFDLSPPPPGETLDAYGPLEKRLVKVVDTTEVAAPPLTGSSTGPQALRDHHEVTVILVDTSGRRIGETAGFAEFDISGR